MKIQPPKNPIKPQKERPPYWFVLLIFLFVFILFFAACTTQKKAYRVVSNDTFRSQSELNIISKICADEFPVKVDTVTTIVTVDSSDYLEYAKFLEGYIDSISKNPSVVTVNDTTVITKTVITKAPPIIKTITNTVSVLDSAAMNKHVIAVNQCRKENDNLAAIAYDAERKAEQNKESRNIWRAIAIGLMILIGGGFILKIKRVL